MSVENKKCPCGRKIVLTLVLSKRKNAPLMVIGRKKYFLLSVSIGKNALTSFSGQ